jgi:hypothetical protein
MTVFLLVSSPALTGSSFVQEIQIVFVLDDVDFSHVKKLRRRNHYTGW